MGTQSLGNARRFPAGRRVRKHLTLASPRAIMTRARSCAGQPVCPRVVVFAVLQVLVRQKVIEKLNLASLPSHFGEAASSVVPNLVVFWIVAGQLRDPRKLVCPVEPQGFYALPEEGCGGQRIRSQGKKRSPSFAGCKRATTRRAYY